MAIKLSETNGSSLLEVQVQGSFARQDYRQFERETRRLVKQRGRIRLLIELADFHGWEADALWDDVLFDVKHFADIERLAMVGENKWAKRMSLFCKPSSLKSIRHFQSGQATEARAWLTNDR